MSFTMRKNSSFHCPNKCIYAESSRRSTSVVSQFESLPTELLLNILCWSSNHLLPLASRTIYIRLSNPAELEKIRFLVHLHRDWLQVLRRGLHRRFFTLKTLTCFEHWLRKQGIISELSLENFRIPGSLLLKGKEDLVLALYSRGARIEKLDFELVICDVIRLQRIPLLRALVKAKADFMSENVYDEALATAVSMGDKRICDILIENGAVVGNCKGLLGNAIQNGNNRMVKYLLSKGAIPDMKSLLSLPV